MKKVTLNNQQRYQICLKKQDDPRITQKELINWCEQEFGIKVDQATISRTLKRSYEYLDNETNLLQNPLQKKPRNVRYPELELALQEWCLRSQNHIPLTDLIITEKAKSFAKLLNIPDDALTFSSGWLQSFKNRYIFTHIYDIKLLISFITNNYICRNNLKRYQLHGESGSADTNAIENALPDLKAIIGSFRPECVYNMDETGLFFRQVYYYKQYLKYCYLLM
jgi:hypothetical protein